MNTYYYIIPIIPNPSEYLSSIIQFMLPLLLLVKLNKYVILEDDEYITDDRKINTIPALAISMILVIAMSYLVSGYFYYEAIAIASGSMSPNISKGDVVIVEKDTTNLKVGTVIAYKHDNIIIVHRLVNIVSDGKTNYYYTKGDSNNMVDNYPILIDDIIGKVDVKIPYVGIPTVWLNSLF